MFSFARLRRATASINLCLFVSGALLALEAVSLPTLAENALAVMPASFNGGKVVSLKHRELPEMKDAKDLGRAPAGMTMGLQLVLRRPATQQQALQEFKRQTQDSHNPLFGATLTAEEFAQRFGLAGADLEAITAWLEAQGFKVGTVDNGRLAIDFSGTAGQVEQAFQTEIHIYEGTDGARHYAHATAMQIPKALGAFFGGIAGMENFRAFQAKNFDGPVTDFLPGTSSARTAADSAAGGGGATPSREAAPLHVSGEPLRDASFTASRYNFLPGGSATLNVRIGGANHAATGSLTISEEEANGRAVAIIPDITACTSYNGGYGRSCTLDYTPATAGTRRLRAVYSGDANERATEQKLAVTPAGADLDYVGASSTPAYNNGGSFANTFTVVTTWVGSSQLTGTVSLELNIGSGVVASGCPCDIGDVTLPASGQTTSSGSGTTFFGEPYSYSCTASLAAQNVTCTVDEPDEYFNEPDYGTYGVDAEYSGDSNYEASSQESYDYDEGNSPSVTPAVMVTGGATSATYGQSTPETSMVTVTVVDTEGDPAGDAAYPSAIWINSANQLGTPVEYNMQPGVDCVDNGANFVCGPISLSWTVAPVLPPGTYTVEYDYSGTTGVADLGDGNADINVGSTSNMVTVVQAGTTTAVTNVNPSSEAAGSGTPVTVTGTISWTGSGALPTGGLTFSSTAGGSFSGSPVCTGNSSPITCTQTFNPTISDLPNTYTMSASYAGDSNYTSSMSTQTGNFTITTSIVPTTTALTTSTNPSTGGQTVSFTATVTPAPTAATGLGSVTFKANNKIIGTIGLLTADAGKAVLNDSSLLPSGSAYSVVASYSGSSDLSGSTSNTVMQTVNVEPTTTTLGASNMSPTYGQSVTLTATVSSTNMATPTGDVIFKNGTASIGTLALVKSGTGMSQAVLHISSLPVAMNSITADYTGSSLMQTSTSSATTITVSQATSTTTITSSSNPSVYGQTVTFTATVTPTDGGTATGTVKFLKNGASIGVLNLSGGKATLPVTTLTPGSYTITATYNGSSNVAGSTGTLTGGPQVVGKASTTTAVMSSSLTVTHGTPVTYTATVTATAPSTAAATGSVVFYDTFNSVTTELGVGTLSGGKATLMHTYTAAQEGMHSIAATYTGSAYVNASPASPAISETVD